MQLGHKLTLHPLSPDTLRCARRARRRTLFPHEFEQGTHRVRHERTLHDDRDVLFPARGEVQDAIAVDVERTGEAEALGRGSMDYLPPQSTM